MTDKVIISKLTFSDFKNLCLQKVRSDNCLDLVDSWQDNILHLDFTKSKNGDYYSSTIYFIEECSKDRYFIKVYRYSYLVKYETFFINDYQLIAREVLQKIAKFENLVSVNKDKLIYNLLKELKK